MAEDAKTRELIEAAVAEVFDQHMRALHDNIVGRVIGTIDALEQSKPEPPPLSECLKSAVQQIESTGQQADILKALLDGTKEFCERAALFLLRGATAVMWQGRGFADSETFRSISVALNAGPAATAVHQCVPARGQASEFHERFGTGADRCCTVIPLVIREKVAALLYCDGALRSETLDISALELLAGAAGKWIELQAFRRTAGTGTPAPKATAPEMQQADTSTSAPTSAASSPVLVPAAQPQLESAKRKAVTVAGKEPEQRTSHMAVAQKSGAGVPAENHELHTKARRFAKLLVDEIILYNRDKVSEGRRHHDIYDRLKDDIDKSRATYDRRYGGQSSVAEFDYFTQAVINGLAEHNMALLGSNFPR